MTTNIPIIAYNGAFIFQPSTGEILSREDFAEEERSRVKEVLLKNRVSPLVYSFVDDVEKVSWIPQNKNEGISRYMISFQRTVDIAAQCSRNCTDRNIGVRSFLLWQLRPMRWMN